MLKWLFFIVVVRPLVLVVLGMNVRNRARLPAAGPAIVVANHNSHLDTLVLMSLFPLCMLLRVRPVAAEEYFLRTRLLSWIARQLIGIIPLRRTGFAHEDELFKGLDDALAAGGIVIIYPEGTRGEPEQMTKFKSGIAHVAERHPTVPVVPVYLHGLGKALPKGDWLLVPFFCDVFVGEAMTWSGNRHDYMAGLESSMKSLADEGRFTPWA